MAQPRPVKTPWPEDADAGVTERLDPTFPGAAAGRALAHGFSTSGEFDKLTGCRIVRHPDHFARRRSKDPFAT
jgi:hypothetical protein